jgi:hypothetical protein
MTRRIKNYLEFGVMGKTDEKLGQPGFDVEFDIEYALGGYVPPFREEVASNNPFDFEPFDYYD